MSTQAERNMRNVIVLALADGTLSDEEKRFIDELRIKSGIGDEQFRRLCRQVREEPGKLAMSADPQEVREGIALLAEAAAADGRISPSEQELLQRLGQRVGMDDAAINGLIDSLAAAQTAREGQIETLIKEIYAGFAGWDERTRNEKLAAVGAFGRAATMHLVRALESYRTPAGAADALEVKKFIAVQLGLGGDDRAAYYLAQQVNIGDADDEITNSALRCAAAEALGKLVGESFGPDQAGVEQARGWWQLAGHTRYDRLAF